MTQEDDNWPYQQGYNDALRGSEYSNFYDMWGNQYRDHIQYRKGFDAGLTQRRDDVETLHTTSKP